MKTLIPNSLNFFLIKAQYEFVTNSMNQRYDNITSSALRDTKAYDFYFNNHFSLTLNFLTPKERDFHCPHDLMLLTKLTHTYTYYEFLDNTTYLTHHHKTHNTDSHSLTPNTPLYTF